MLGSERRCLAHNPFRGRPLFPFIRGLRLVAISRCSGCPECDAYSCHKSFHSGQTTLRPLVMELVISGQHNVSFGVSPFARDRRLRARHGEHVSRTRAGRVHRPLGGRAGDDCVEDIEAEPQGEGKARVCPDWCSACEGGAFYMPHSDLLAITSRCLVGRHIDSAVSYSCPRIEHVRRSCDVFFVG